VKEFEGLSQNEIIKKLQTILEKEAGIEGFFFFFILKNFL